MSVAQGVELWRSLISFQVTEEAILSHKQLDEWLRRAFYGREYLYRDDFIDLISMRDVLEIVSKVHTMGSTMCHAMSHHGLPMQASSIGHAQHYVTDIDRAFENVFELIHAAIANYQAPS
jgi:hypothetical protein